jgi:putative endonuclease
MTFLYILYSKIIDRYYIGVSPDVEDRLCRHNNSGNKSTKCTYEWKLVYKESYSTRSNAMKREFEIKGKKSRKYIDWLISKRT